MSYYLRLLLQKIYLIASRQCRLVAPFLIPFFSPLLFFSFLLFFLAHIPRCISPYTILDEHRLRSSKVGGLLMLLKFPFVQYYFGLNCYPCSPIFSLFDMLSIIFTFLQKIIRKCSFGVSCLLALYLIFFIMDPFLPSFSTEN